MTLNADLALDICIIFAGSVVLFLFAVTVQSRRSALCVALLATAALVINAIWLNEDPILTHILPVANVIVWGNIELPAAAVLAGIAWSTLKTPAWQRSLIICALGAIGIWREIEPVIGSPPQIGPSRWTNHVCRQSSTSSCSAAAAATLLVADGIPANEAEMIPDCLTHIGGTTTLGLYRGLKLMTAGSRWSARVDDCGIESIEQWHFPAIVTVRMSGPAAFLGGPGHSIVIFRRTETGKLDIGDPFTGRQIWTRQQLADVFAGELFTLVLN